MADRVAEDGDAELVQAVLEGDARAFDALVERHFGMVFLVGVAHLDNREAAEDLAQEVFLTAYLRITRIAAPQCFAAWLRQIARNRAIDWLRRDQRESRLVRTVSIEDIGDEVADTQTKGARDVVEASERHRAVYKAIRKLHPDQRELVLLYYVEGLSKSELARRTATHPSTIARRLDKALTAMKTALEPVMRELAPTMKAPPAVTARTSALVAAVSAMSAAKQDALAQAAVEAGKLAATSLAPPGGTNGIGALVALLKTILAKTATGASALNIKTPAAAAILALALAAGSVLLPNPIEQKAQGAGAAAKPLEFPLEMKTLPPTANPGVIGFPYLPSLGSVGCTPMTERPDVIVNEPDTLSQLPLYGALKFGEGAPVSFRLDESMGPDGGYDRLIIDFNGNGDLTDDRRIMAAEDLTSREIRGRQTHFSSENVYFGPFRIPKGKGQGGWNPNLCARFNLNYAGPGEPSFAHFRVTCLSYLATTIEVNGIRQRIWLVDSNFNQRLGEKVSVDVRELDDGSYLHWEQFDRILRERDDSGRCRSFAWLHGEDYLSSLICFGANPYRFTLADDLSSVRLEPYSGPTGDLDVPDHVKALSLFWRGPDGEWAFLAIEPKDGKVKIPEGNCYLLTCVVASKLEGGDTIGGFAFKAAKLSDPPRIVAGKTTSLICGPPLVPEVNAGMRADRPAVASRGGGPPCLEFSIKTTGAAGEEYVPWLFSRFSPEGVVTKISPRFRILDEDDKEVASGRLDSDKMALGMKHSWLVPKHLAGKKIRIVPDLDLGPVKTTGKPLEFQL